MRHLATIQKIEEVQSIEGADSIEKVRIKEWWCVQKHRYCNEKSRRFSRDISRTISSGRNKRMTGCVLTVQGFRAWDSAIEVRLLASRLS